MKTEEKLKITKEHWENPKVESLKDSNLRNLEISAITRMFKKFSNDPTRHFRLADYGCGDGYDTLIFSKYATQSVGFDYSSEMIQRANKRGDTSIKFKKIDLINDSVPGKYELSVSKRFIINLGEWKIQRECIKKIGDSLVSGGVFMFLECFQQGLDTLNIHINKLGGKKLEQPYHNTYLDYDKTLEYLTNYFDILEVLDFSTYFFLTRCVSPFIVEHDVYKFDKRMCQLSEANDFFQGMTIGPQRLICLRKK